MSKRSVLNHSYSTSVFMHINDGYGNELHIPYAELEIFRKMVNERVDEILAYASKQSRDEE